jgi:hypothetical protein
VGLGDTLHVLGALWFNTGEVLATDINKLREEGVSERTPVLEKWMTYRKLASHDSSGVLFEVDESKYYALWSLVSTELRHMKVDDRLFLFLRTSTLEIRP